MIVQLLAEANTYGKLYYRSYEDFTVEPAILAVQTISGTVIDFNVLSNELPRNIKIENITPLWEQLESKLRSYDQINYHDGKQQFLKHLLKNPHDDIIPEEVSIEQQKEREKLLLHHFQRHYG